MGTLAKAKANVAQGIPELLEMAVNKRFLENRDPRHIRNAQYGWCRYDAYFELPVYDEDGEIERYNRFRATTLIRHSANGKKYLYDILDIKKKRATLSAHNELTRHKTHFSLAEMQHRWCQFVNCFFKFSALMCLKQRKRRHRKSDLF